MYRCSAWTLLVACSLLIGCSDSPPDDGQEDSGAQDAATQNDATANTEDATTQQDASVVADATVEDSSVPPDAVVPPDPPVTPSVAGQVVFSEIFTKPLGYADQAEAEWIEIYNPSTTVSYNLKNCAVSDDKASSVINTDLIVAPGEYVVLVASLAATTEQTTVTTHGFVSDFRYGPKPGWGSSDIPTLTCNTVIIDSFSYATGVVFPTLVDNYSIQLSVSALTGTANDLGTNWCVGVAQFMADNPATGTEAMPLVELGYGTPGAANVACPVLP